MSDMHLPKATKELVDRRHALAPGVEDAFRAFSQAVFAEGALASRTMQLTAAAFAHVSQRPRGMEAILRSPRRAAAAQKQWREANGSAARGRAGASGPQ